MASSSRRVKKDYFFVPNACQVCRKYGKDVTLIRCSRCKAIPYCSKQHEKEHRPRHIEFCEAFTKVLAATERVVRAFQSVELRDSEDTPSVAWRTARSSLLELTEEELDRDLTNFEKTVIRFPRHCEICYETDDSELTDCGDCPDASFCTKHPKDEGRHAEKCQQSKLCFLANTNVSDPNIVSLATVAFMSHYGNRVPANMDQAIALFLEHPLLAERFPNTHIYSVLISNDVTRVYTFLYAVKKLYSSMLPKLTLHMIVKDEEENNKAMFWQNLFHHSLPYRDVDVFHFHPELPYTREELTLCEECTKKNCSIVVRSIGDSYTDYSKSPFFTEPDFVLALNVALDLDDELAPSIQLVAKLGCPFIITTYTAKQTEDNHSRINAILGKTVKPWWTGENPFASRKPYKDFDTDEFFFHNHYLTIYKKLA